MFNNALNSLRSTFGVERPIETKEPNFAPNAARKDYLGSRDDLGSAGISGSKINAESGRSYVTQDRPSLQLLENLQVLPKYDRHGKFILGSGNNSVGISLARDPQVPDDHPQAYVAMKTLVSHEQAEREFAIHQALGNDLRFVRGLDVSHVAQDGRSYIFMERMSGGDAKAHLESIFSNRKLSAAEKNSKILEAVHGYLDCLKALHDKDFKHGDIDIGNFFHDSSGNRTSIGDFGSARPATPAQKKDEAVELGMMLNREVKSRAKHAGVDTRGLDNVIGVLYGNHPDSRVKQDPIGMLLKNWQQIQS